MKRIFTLLAMVTTFFLMLGVVNANQDTRLNITMVETVYQNVSFARDFYLVEDQEYCTILGVINVTNPSGESVADIYLTFANTDNMNGNFTHFDGRYGLQVSGDTPGDPFILHIVELMAGNHSSFNYSIDCASVEPPLDIDTFYDNVETGINRKVLAGHNWTITQNASNQLAIAEDIENIVVTIYAQEVEWNASSESFQLVDLQTVGDHAQVTTTTPEEWTWTVNGGTLTPGQWAFITYDVQAPEGVPTSDTYLAILEELEYTIAFLASNLSLTNVAAIGDVDMRLDKRIISPADNENNTNVTWEVNAELLVPFNISYNLTSVSIWVTTTLDPTDTFIPGGFGYLNTTQTPNSEINQSLFWDATPWQFNYTDGSDNLSSRPPIVWLRPHFTLLNARGQIVNSTTTQSGDDLYMKYIYVVNGYWLEIEKNITNIGEDQYRIDTIVENIGNAWTPTGLVVTVYDFIPAEFDLDVSFGVAGFSEPSDSNALVTGAGFNGTSYRWSIPLKAPYNSSLGPLAGPNAETYLNRTWNVTYFVNGTGDYRVSELYIVGLDPRKVEGAGSHEGITISTAFANASVETVYLLVVVFLVIINVVNFVMTRRINQKLGNHK